MRLFGAIIAGSALAVTPMLAAAPASAQGNDVLGQVQRFFNGDNNNQQNAYEQGRLDQQRRDQARHEQWRDQRAENYNRDQQPRHDYYNGPRHDQGYNSYNQGYNGYNQAYGGAYGPTENTFGHR